MTSQPCDRNQSPFVESRPRYISPAQRNPFRPLSNYRRIGPANGIHFANVFKNTVRRQTIMCGLGNGAENGIVFFRRQARASGFTPASDAWSGGNRFPCRVFSVQPAASSGTLALNRSESTIWKRRTDWQSSFGIFTSLSKLTPMLTPDIHLSVAAFAVKSDTDRTSSRSGRRRADFRRSCAPKAESPGSMRR